MSESEVELFATPCRGHAAGRLFNENLMALCSGPQTSGSKKSAVNRVGIGRMRGRVMRCANRIAALALFFMMFTVLPGRCEEASLNVFVSVLPQRYFVEKIGAERVRVYVMVRPGASPATYEPKPNQMVALADSSIYFAVGVPFEAAWLDRIASMNPRLRIVRTDDGIQKRTMENHHHHENQGGKAAEKEDGHQSATDPHVWLSPPLVMLQARNILDALVQADPGGRASYEAHYRRFISEVVDLDLDIRALFEGRGERGEFLVFHPAWGYFAAAYGLKQVPVEIEGKEPKAADLMSLIQYARERGIRTVFVQPQFSTRSAKVLAESLGGKTVFADPLAAEWEANLRAVARDFSAALN